MELDVDGSIDVLSDEEAATHLRVGGAAPLCLRFSRRSGERLVGFGERFGSLDQTGRRFEGRIVDLLAADPQDTYFHLPFCLSSAGYGVLVHTHAQVRWDLGASDPSCWTVEVPAAEVDLWILRGRPRRVVSEMTSVAGRPAVPPPWVLGVWKTTLGGSEAVLRQAQRLRDHEIPVTACWVYDHYHEETNSGCGYSGTYPAGPYPDLAAMVDGLHDLGFRALGYVQPGLFEGSAPYRYARDRGYLARGPDGEPALVPYFNPKTHPEQIGSQGRAAYVDLTDPDAAGWYRGLLEEILEQGWDGWMQDMGEHLPDDALLADGTDGRQSRNRYPLLYHRLAHDVWSRRDDTAVFARSGALGSVPYVSAMWPGDQHADWSSDRGLRSVLPAGPSAGLCGVGAWGPDINGIVDGRDGGAGGRDEELWIRWCQYGALNPIMRDHLGFKLEAGTPVDLWTSDRTVDTFRRYARLHLSLYPYLRALAEEAAETGIPIVRALLLEYPDHEEAWTIPDQYLLGDALLVAPVHEPGARSREVWFPPGEWVDWWDGTRHGGPGWRTVDAPLERIPLYQRVGTTVQMLGTPTAALDAVRDADVVARSV